MCQCQAICYVSSRCDGCVIRGLLLSHLSLSLHYPSPYHLNPFVNTQSAKNWPDNFENILLTKAFLGKHLKEKC